MKHKIGVVVVMQALVMHAIGGFIVGKARVSECSGSLTLLQSGRRHLKILSSTPSLKFSKKEPVRVRVEENCCWTVISRKNFKGFKTFLQRQGERHIKSHLVRSIASTKCSSMPRLYVAGSGLVTVVVVTLVGLLVSFVFIHFKRKKNVKLNECSEEKDKLAAFVT